jgi:hypothetical protein
MTQCNVSHQGKTRAVGFLSRTAKSNGNKYTIGSYFLHQSPFFESLQGNSGCVIREGPARRPFLYFQLLFWSRLHTCFLQNYGENGIRSVSVPLRGACALEYICDAYTYPSNRCCSRSISNAPVVNQSRPKRTQAGDSCNDKIYPSHFQTSHFQTKALPSTTKTHILGTHQSRYFNKKQNSLVLRDRC